MDAGVDPARSLADQKDTFWWGSRGFEAMAEPFEDFRLVISGYCRAAPRLEVGPHAAIVDGGAGRGGSLYAVCFDGAGQVADYLESVRQEGAA